MSNLLTAVWGPKFGSFNTLSLNQKWADFQVAVYSAHAAMSNLAHKMGFHKVTMLFVAPEYYFIKDASFGLLTGTEKDRLDSALRSMSSGARRMVIVPGTINYRTELKWYNRNKVRAGRTARTYAAHSYCPVYFSGNTVLKYYKRMNDGNYDSNYPQNDAYFVPGSKAAKFTCNGIRFGVDICGDYTEGRLAGDVPSRDLDVHVYSSGTNLQDFRKTNLLAARDGGYFVHSDCADDPFQYQNRNGVWAVQRGGGLHSGSQGETAREMLSHASLNHSMWKNTPMNQRYKTKMKSAVRAAGTRGNVTRQSPLRLPVYVTGLQIFTCPL